MWAAGKTNIAMLTILHELSQHIEGGVLRKEGFKVVYVAPMKALAQEVQDTFQRRLSCLGLVVKELTGDMQLTKREIKETQVIVTTPEKCRGKQQTHTAHTHRPHTHKTTSQPRLSTDADVTRGFAGSLCSAGAWYVCCSGSILFRPEHVTFTPQPVFDTLLIASLIVCVWAQGRDDT